MDDIPEVIAAAERIEQLLAPKPDLRPKRHVNWRDTELGTFEEEAVKDLGRHTI